MKVVPGYKNILHIATPDPAVDYVAYEKFFGGRRQATGTFNHLHKIAFFENREYLHLSKEEKEILLLPLIKPPLVFGPWPKPLLGKFTPSNYKECLSRIKKILLDNNISLIHLHGVSPELSPIIAAGKMLRIPLLIELRDMPNQGGYRPENLVHLGVAGILLSGRKTDLLESSVEAPFFRINNYLEDTDESFNQVSSIYDRLLGGEVKL